MSSNNARKPAHNVTLPVPIPFSGSDYGSFADLYRSVSPPPAVPEVTLQGRIKRGLQKHGAYSDDWLAEAIHTTARDFRAKYSPRRTWVIINGARRDLREVYDALQDKPLPYAGAFHQRLAARRRLGRDITMEIVRDAARLPEKEWMTHYGGGRRKPEGFLYDGDAYPGANGQYSSITSFLQRIDRYGDRRSIHTRLKNGWDIDDALTRPPIERDKDYGVVYLITQESTGMSYVGISFCGAKSRLKQHCRSAFEQGGSTPLYLAMRATGIDDFQMEIIEEGVMSEEELAAKERRWIASLDTIYPKGLNANGGGSTGRVEGKQVTVDGVVYQSIEAAARRIAKKRGLNVHVVRSAITEGRPIPENPRTHSDHPLAGTILFRKWLGMLKRSTNSSSALVVYEWRDFDVWYQDTNAAGKEKLNLIRPDRSEPWGPRNFAWGSDKELIEAVHGREFRAFGRIWPSKQAACEEYGIGKGTLWFRLKRGMTPEEALTEPISKTSRAGKSFEFEGVSYRSRHEAAKLLSVAHDITYHQAKDRLTRGIPTKRWSQIGQKGPQP
ncbi:GIY-YIG nuclease family protein [Defluviimonas salinarum]|uniref:GIY-YIG nuclease family protein n=1 Tax=Defluviimonas salinarum TaxID=2992147 RepID=A0ABT3J927_9RHOB|nr:GIY-YIG nuclease family protein [Defluviimonas salinarum]MCW3784192.1 GIY-YIG nuclease family protein [Defluviimonas salinarum]